MKSFFLIFTLTTTLFGAAASRADDSELLPGKWSAKKVTDDGANCTQVITINKGKFAFQRVGPDGKLVVRAEGDMKFEKFGPFKAIRCWHMRGAEGSGDLEDLDEDYVLIYSLDDDTWTVASNFDKEREEKPGVDVYHRVKAERQADAKDALPATPPGQQWKLVWQDEFDGSQLDETRWNRLGDYKRRDGFWVKNDAYLSGHGTLLLRTQKDGERYTCGAINTQGKFEHAFGYYVARCKMPRQAGHWPAFWMMCPGVSKIGDDGKDGTEIDIVEMPWRDGKITMNLHWDGYAKEHKSAGTKTTIPAVTEGFHDYGLWWTKENYVFYVDGQEVWRSAAGGVSQVPEYLKLTEEIGTWAGDISKAQLPDYFEVEYVRVYDLSEP